MTGTTATKRPATKKAAAKRPATKKPSVAKAASGPAIKRIDVICRITCTEDGLFCCGQRHSVKPVDYPVGWFSEDQLRQMTGHPAFIVEQFEAGR